MDVFITHSAKGTTWKNHKYIGKEGKRYIYPPTTKKGTRFNKLSNTVKSIKNAADIAALTGNLAVLTTSKEYLSKRIIDVKNQQWDVWLKPGSKHDLERLVLDAVLEDLRKKSLTNTYQTQIINKKLKQVNKQKGK